MKYSISIFEKKLIGCCLVYGVKNMMGEIQTYGYYNHSWYDPVTAASSHALFENKGLCERQRGG